MKSNLKQVVGLVLFVAMFTLVASAQIITKKVSFPAGKSSTTIQGKIVGEQTIDYTVSLSEGQELKVGLTTKSPSCYFNLLAPGSNDEAIFIGSNDGNNFGGTLSLSGVYKIRVYLYRNAARQGKSADFSIVISTTGGNNQANDAKVPGTNYHATGDLRAANGDSRATAKFGVIRSSGGKAEVHAKITGGLGRIFIFSQGEWRCKSDSCGLIFNKKGDEWELIVNDYEHYYIPEAVIYGG